MALPPLMGLSKGAADRPWRQCRAHPRACKPPAPQANSSGAKLSPDAALTLRQTEFFGRPSSLLIPTERPLAFASCQRRGPLLLASSNHRSRESHGDEHSIGTSRRSAGLLRAGQAMVANVSAAIRSSPRSGRKRLIGAWRGRKAWVNLSTTSRAPDFVIAMDRSVDASVRMRRGVLPATYRVQPWSALNGGSKATQGLSAPFRAAEIASVSSLPKFNITR
jgi:hypothetical protein